MNLQKFKKLQSELNKVNDKKLIIWGAAAKGKFIKKWVDFLGYKDYLVGFVDKNVFKQGQRLLGLDIYGPECIRQYDESYVVLIASVYVNDIVDELKELNSKVEYIDCCEFAVLSRIEETFSVYSKKRYYLLRDHLQEEAVSYLKLYGVDVEKTMTVDEVEPDNGNSDIVYIIISKDHIAIEKELIKKGYSYNKDYVVLTEIFEDEYHYTKKKCVSRVVDRGTMGDKHMEEYFCPLPFTQLYYYENRSGICSPTWNNGVSTGSPRNYSIEELWNSPMAQTIRASILSGSFCFCNQEMCWRMLEGKLFKKSEITDPKWLEIINGNKLSIEGGPEFLNIGYNPACNLKCKMCRSEIVPVGRIKDSDNLVQNLKDFNFTNLKRLIIPGNGELFLNKDYMDILINIDDFQFPSLEAIWIYSNGILFTQENWNKISYLAKRFKLKIFISTDAAKEETYRKVRRSNYKVLLDNLKMLSDERKKGNIYKLYLPFCVQKENFREMTEFVHFAKSVGADCVHFEKLFNNVIDECVHRPENVYYEDFIEQLKSAVETGKKEEIEIDYKPFVSLI